MNQGESLKAISEATGTTPKEARQFIEAVAQLAFKCGRKLDQIHLPGLGKLVGKERKARLARNPHTGKKVKVPAKKVIVFRMDRKLKQALQR